MDRSQNEEPDTRREKDSGVYVLVVGLKSDKRIEIGALGNVFFSRGLYFYVGSGFCGIARRVKRHFMKKKTCRWHIDHFLRSGRPLGVMYILTSQKDAECRMARALDRRFDSIPHFGCSDCRCRSHLFYQKVEGECGEEIS